MRKVFYVILVLFFQTNLFSQKINAVQITGTVHVISIFSSGVMDGGSTQTGAGPFANQPLYFVNGKDTLVTRTSLAGIFKLKLKPGIYNIYQKEAIKFNMGEVSYGSANIEVKNKNEAFKIEFRNVTMGD